MKIAIRPIEQWPGELARVRKPSPFESSYSDTMELLGRELRMLRATGPVIQLAVTEDQIRLDGALRAAARPEHPGVILSFRTPEGTLRFSADRFTHWHANLRAIALGLEALRKVDRYGIGQGGEQYTGWKQLDAAPEPERPMTADDARAFMARYGDYRTAARKLHPDVPGGDERLFKRLQEARRILDRERG